MISDEVDINSLKTFTGDTALHTVCRQSAMDPFKKLQVCKLLLNLTDIDVCLVNLKGMTPIHYASRSKDKDALKLLLDRDKDNLSLDLTCQDQGKFFTYVAQNSSALIHIGKKTGNCYGITIFMIDIVKSFLQSIKNLCQLDFFTKSLNILFVLIYSELS
jgi:ankyrin repeat protein